MPGDQAANLALSQSCSAHWRVKGKAPTLGFEDEQFHGVLNLLGVLPGTEFPPIWRDKALRTKLHVM